jgi:acyl-CoA thioester hydrolase
LRLHGPTSYRTAPPKAGAAGAPRPARATDVPAIHRQRIRVYYEDTDAAGIVYYANYLRFFERVRTDWLRSHGVTQASLLQSHRLVFVVRDCQIDYLAPARLDDELDVDLCVAELRRASIRFIQHARDVKSGVVLATAAVRVAAMQVESGRPTSVPADVEQRLRTSISPTPQNL